MKVIILVENSRCEMKPLTEQFAHALLPLAGKPLLLHALESLHRSGMRDVTVVSPTHHGELALKTDTGPLLGMKVAFQADLPYFDTSNEHCLVIGLRELVDVHWPDVMEPLGDLDVHVTVPILMTVRAVSVALLLPPRFNGRLSTDWSDIHRTEAITLPIGPMPLVATGTIQEYFSSSFKVLRCDYQTLKPAGRKIAEGHFAAPKARFRPDSVNSERACLGANCRVEKGAQLHGNVIIGDNAVIGRKARITDSIILDGTYLGAQTDCRNAIVCGNLLLRVDSGVCVRLDDPLLFGKVA